MALTPGTRLGPYEVISALGAGGMGEVYRARDTRLARTVAIKVVGARAENPESRRRLQREAKAISALEHPNICALYDVGHHEGIDFLVMQHLEGETLAERLRRGPIPMRELLRVATEIADALDRAHRAGIVHRDLKPANIMLTDAGAKLLDFGIAKAAPVTAPEAATARVAADEDLTVDGALVGTVGYIAPEQLKGWRVDARSDLFALGAILYEMASGVRAFDGATRAAVIDAVLNRQPAPLATLVPGVPPAFSRIVAKCLSKEIEARWQTARDLEDELKWVASNTSASSEQHAVHPRHGWARQPRARWVAGVVLAASTALSTLWWRDALLVRRPSVPQVDTVSRGARPSPPAAPAATGEPGSGASIGSAAGMPLQLSIALPKDLSIRSGGPELALSPDGRRVAFRAFSSRGWMLYLRSLDSPELTLLPGTEYARYAFWSPKGDALGFFSAGKLNRIDLVGTSARVLCDAPSPRGGAWNADGTIVFAAALEGNGLYTVDAAGGAPRPLTKVDREHGEKRHEWPVFLPDGRRFLYATNGKGSSRAGIYIQALGAAAGKQVLPATSNVAYASNHLVFSTEGTLWAVPFDVDRAEVTGAPRELATGLLTRGARAEYAIADSVLAYWRGEEVAGQVTSLDRTGKLLQSRPSPLTIKDPALSRDGRLLAFSAPGAGTSGSDIWLLDWANGNRRRITLQASSEYNPVWSPDGKRLIFASDRDGGMNLYQKDLASGREDLILHGDAAMYPTDWSRDGQFVVFEKRQSAAGARDLWVLPMSGDRRPFAVVASEADERQGQLSPDDRWLAYTSKESGRWQVFVRPLRSAGRVWQVSPDNGVQPAWSPDGSELFYLTGDRNLMSVSMTAGQSFDLGAPKRLFASPAANMHPRGVYGVGADGRQFVFSAVPETSAELITVVTNWGAIPPRR
jgi:serine/threonine protein kinase